MSDTEERLRDAVQSLLRKNEALESELQTVRSFLASAEYRIENDLEPRIRNDNRAYDLWVAAPDRGF